MYEPKGQALEVGMINFLVANGCDAREAFIQRNKYNKKVCQIPFD